MWGFVARRAAVVTALAVGLTLTDPGPLRAATSDLARVAVGPASLVPPAAAPGRPKTLVVGIDGATFSRVGAARTPSLTALRRSGLTAPSALYAPPMAPTLSGPGWTTVATGVWPDRHGVVDNTLAGLRRARFPDYLSRLESARPALRTLVVGTWGPISDGVFGPKVDRRVAGSDDDATTDVAVAALRDGDPDSTFVQLDEVDGAGHAHGASSPEYAAALEEADRRLGRLLGAIRGRASLARESWLVVVTADHGHTDGGGHGGGSPAERSTFVVASGPGLRSGSVRDDVRVVDVAASVLDHHGMTVRPGPRMDGEPLRAQRPDAFDRRRAQLRTRLDEPSAPGRGWSHRMPRGWGVDNTRMPDGGVREWRGWALTTDPFWTATDPGQGRETAVRTRGVFAVADSDEWDDRPHAAGRFDSTLRTPSYPLRDARRIDLRFVSTYRVDGPQSATVAVVFDRGGVRTVRRYTGDVNRLEHATVRVPATARRVSVRFRYTGVNSAFWAIDDVRVVPARR